MKILTVLLAVFAVATAPTARAADGASVHAVLILASQAKAPADPRLAPYEATLQRNLPESSFKFVAEGSASVSGANGHAAIGLGGHRIEIEGGSRSADGIQLRVNWTNAGASITRTALIFQPGVPVVLGQRTGDDGKINLVVVTVR